MEKRLLAVLCPAASADVIWLDDGDVVRAAEVFIQHSIIDLPNTHRRLSTVGDRAIPVAAAHVWNSLRQRVRHIHGSHCQSSAVTLTLSSADPVKALHFAILV